MQQVERPERSPATTQTLGGLAGQPFRPWVASPWTKYRWPRKNTMIIGIVVITLAARTTSHSISPPWPNWSSTALSPAAR